MIKRFIRLFNTIKYLRSVQVFYRLIYLLPKNHIYNKKNSFILNNINFKTHFPKYKNITIDYKNFKFLNEKKNISNIGWESKNLKKLFIYNLHYFDYLIQKKNNFKILQKNLILNWIDKNKNVNSIGWDSYPLSIRIVNWIKWHSFNNKLNLKILNSLYNQTIFLSKNFEFHLLGNHLFANLKAIFFSRFIFNDEKINKIYLKALKIFESELDEQFLDDGGHFEQSPMYHAILIEDLLDLINISSHLPENFPKKSIIKKIEKGMKWLYYMSYKSGDFPHFNDSVNYIAPHYKLLLDYSKRLDIKINKPKIKNLFLKDSGYYIIKNSKIHLIADVGKIGPDYLPGHAHADSLSFELSINNERFLVNSGISTYENNKIRSWQRGTSSHNTIEINNLNSSDVWSSFRVGKRAFPSKLISNYENNKIEFSCEHNGYASFFNQIIHQRSWVYQKNRIIVTDKITGNFKECKSRFYFFPNIKLAKNNKKIIASNNKKILCTIYTEEKTKILISNYYPSFGIEVPNLHLLINYKKSGTYKTIFEF